MAPGEGGEGFQIKGTDAVAAAIWAFVARWDGPPADAVIAAVHFGGDTDTIACMTGVLLLAVGCSSLLKLICVRQRDSSQLHAFL